MLRAGEFRADKVQYEDGIGCCIWELFSEDENTGTCFDFAYDDIDDILDLLHGLKEIPAETIHQDS